MFNMKMPQDNPELDHDDRKAAQPEHVIGVVEDFPAVPMPESLQNYTDDELAAIEKRLRRKADLTIMPIIGILYILNCQSCS